MTGFAVVRHPEAGLGTAPAEAMDDHRARGWVRVSEYRHSPFAFDLSEFTDAPDLDAAPTPEPATAADDNPEEE